MTIDVDSTICEVSGKAKAGAAYGHTEQLGYHPLVGVRAESGEIVHTRLRGGSSQSGNVHFIAETVARARRAGATGELCVRADSGFFSYDLLDRLDALKVRRSITIPQYAHVKAAVSAIPEADWAPIAYTDSGEANVTETTLTGRRRANKRELRLVVRRTRLSDLQQAELWPHWRYHAFITNRTDLDTIDADASTAPTPPSNSPPVTSRVPPARPTCRRGASPPTPPGSPPPPSPTTSTAGSPTSARSAAAGGSPSGKRSATTSSPCPGASSTTPDAPSCAYPHDGPGNHLPHHPHQHPRPTPTLLNLHQCHPPRPDTSRHRAPTRPNTTQTRPTRPHPAPTRPTRPTPRHIKRRQPHPTAANHQQTAATHPHRWIQAKSARG